MRVAVWIAVYQHKRKIGKASGDGGEMLDVVVVAPLEPVRRCFENRAKGLNRIRSKIASFTHRKVLREHGRRGSPGGSPEFPDCGERSRNLEP